MSRTCDCFSDCHSQISWINLLCNPNSSLSDRMVYFSVNKKSHWLRLPQSSRFLTLWCELYSWAQLPATIGHCDLRQEDITSNLPFLLTLFSLGYISFARMACKCRYTEPLLIAVTWVYLASSYDKPCRLTIQLTTVTKPVSTKLFPQKDKGGSLQPIPTKLHSKDPSPELQLLQPGRNCCIAWQHLI